MKKTLVLSALLLASGIIYGQQNYNSGEKKLFHFGPRNGKLDSICVNPSTKGNVNEKCIKYVRSSGAQYDNIKIYPVNKLEDVTPYATYMGNPPKIKLKVYSTAPAGTTVELQLGTKKSDQYPASVHSQYQAVTKKQNEWEELSFTFSQIPTGSKVAPTEIDKITLIFSPNTSSGDTYFFTDLIAPSIIQGEEKKASK